MQLYRVLILFLSFSAAYGLRCYNCLPNASKSCTDIVTCPAQFDRCASVENNGVVVKSCMPSKLCISPMKCCETDLCNSAVPTGPGVGNGAVPTGPGVILLLLSSALMMLFI